MVKVDEAGEPRTGLVVEGGDPDFGPAYIDVDEWRDAPRRHRFIHGGFEGTATRFSLFFPETDQYRGRMVQELQGGLAGVEPQSAPPELLSGCFDLGAILVMSNQGWQDDPSTYDVGDPDLPVPDDPAVLGYRANAQTARFAKQLAKEELGAAPHHAYLTGLSGGGARTVAGIENAPDLWDGGVPVVMVNQALGWHYWSVWGRAEAVLRGKRELIADAMDAGGSGDPFAVLETDEERERLAELYDVGFPRGAEWMLRELATWFQNWIVRADPRFLEEFWDRYADQTVERIEQTLRVTRIVRAGEAPPGFLANVHSFYSGMIPPDAVVGVCLEGITDATALIGCSVRATSGEGKELLYNALSAVGDVLGTWDARSMFPTALTFDVGDEVRVDNTRAMAWQHYHRHVVDPAVPTMRRWANDGKPIWPQLPVPPDEAIATQPTGRFGRKMIIVQGSQDHLCPPVFAVDYLGRMRSHDDRADERTRLYIIDRMSHGEPHVLMPADMRRRVVSCSGAVLQALTDLVAWVEQDREPLPSTGFRVNAWNRWELAAGAGERAGIQPVIELTVEGGSGGSIKLGEAVRVVARAEAPPGAGTFVFAAWDLDGSAEFKTEHALADHSATTLTFETDATFGEPGTHFVVAKVGIHRDGDADPTRRIYNLARARVTVI